MFSTGFVFFYWEYYRNGGKRKELEGLKTDLNGYTESELSVTPRYSSFKNETLQHLDINRYELAVTKSKEYIKTDRARAIKPNKFCYDDYYHVFNYGVSQNDKISMEHILSIILYCDYSAYCTKFSASFRPLTRTESMKDVKDRNSAFFYQSKLFRETVEGFGHYGYSESGPFYTGLDHVMVIPQFCLHLAAPTSTSKHIEVSLTFSTKAGMIIELNNSSDHYQSNNLPFFDVSWLSRYPDEDERVFTGAFMPIKVVSVRIIGTRRNYESIFKSLFLLDAIVSDGEFNHWAKANDEDIKLIRKLCDLDLLGAANVDKYIKDLISSYIRRRKKIIINVYGLRNIASKLDGLVFDGDLERHKTGDRNWQKSKQYTTLGYDKFNYESNSIHSSIISLLPYASEVIIKTTCGDDYSFPFSLSKLLSAIANISTWNVIKVEQRMTKLMWNNHTSWIFKIWSRYSSRLTREYEAVGLKISYQEEDLSDIVIVYFLISR